MDSDPEKAPPPKAAGLKALWEAIQRNRRPLLLMFGIWIVIAVAAYLVSRSYWRDDLSRSLIGAVTLVAFAATALAVFGAKGPQMLITIVAAFGAVVAIGGGTVKLDSVLSDGPPQEGAVVNCPPEPDEAARHGFVASTDLGFAHLRSEPSLSAEVLLRYPPGCELELLRYCIGEPKVHWRFRVPDPVWFWADGDFRDGWIARADIRAGPGAGSLPREGCVGGKHEPLRPEITAPLQRGLSGAMEIVAAAPYATHVGFAVYYENVPGSTESARWHQISMDVNPSDGITSRWDTRSVPGQSGASAAPLTLIAVACLGLDFAYYNASDELVADMRSYVAANRGGEPPYPAPPPPPADTIAKAGATACKNTAR